MTTRTHPTTGVKIAFYSPCEIADSIPPEKRLTPQNYDGTPYRVLGSEKTGPMHNKSIVRSKPR
jgi:hypothetical protein